MKSFNPEDPRTKKILDDLSDWMEKHNITMYELMDIFSSFMAFASIQSGDPTDFMKRLTGLLKFHLRKHEEK
jgi:hypothetical protein